MSLDGWPRTVPFDPGVDAVPLAVEELVGPAGGGRAILLVAGPVARRSGWAGRAAVALADACAAGGRTVVLADLCLDAPELHERLGVENLEGVADLFLFGASLQRVIRPAPGHAFRFIPAGPFAPEPSDVLGHPRWERLIGDFARTGGSLLLFAAADAPELRKLAGRTGGAILLVAPGEAEAAAAALPEGCPIVAALEEPVKEAPPATPSPGAGAGSPPSEEADEFLDVPIFISRRRARAPWRAIAVGVLVVAALAGGGWFGIRWYYGEAGQQPTAQATTVGGASAPAPSAPADSQPDAAPEESTEPAAAFSVSVVAHQDFAVAEDQVMTLRRLEPGIQFYLSPIVVDGVLYYRVYAGPAADAAAADSLLRRLVEAGHKSAFEPWAIRRTSLAYHLGDFETLQAAQTREAELRAQGIPAYVLEIPQPAGPPRYRLYGGAFEGRGEAQALGELLRRAGLPDSLVRRTGRPPA
ncbi:MAG TPA: SPOR domain-containing protein [Longimicrobiales bacterium]